MPNPGDTRKVNVLKGDKVIQIEQKYFRIEIDFGYRNIPVLLEYTLGVKIYNKYDTSIVKFYPDNDVYLNDLDTNISNQRDLKNLLSYTNINLKRKSQWIIPKTAYNLIYNNGVFVFEAQGGFVPGLGDLYYTLVYGYGVFEFWATFQESQTSVRLNGSGSENTNPPRPLDNDYSSSDALNKINNMQSWSDSYLLPPIFGTTNCVYFPSNLGDSKPTFGSGEDNPIIREYPAQFSMKTDNYFQIKGKKDEEYEINIKFPFINEQDRFKIIEDNYGFWELIGRDSNIPAPVINQKPFEFKINDLVRLRFIEKEEEENPDLAGNLKFNDYLFYGIITAVESPVDNQLETKGKLVIKLLNDYGLTEDNYFDAKIVIDSVQPNNFVQNETYSIKRYYKKDLGIGPRLGGSAVKVYSTDIENTESNPNPNGSYLFYTVLKDDERLNKPYLGIKFSSSFLYQIFTVNSLYVDTGIKSIIHEFADHDMYGNFELLVNNNEVNSGGFRIPESKQYHPDYLNYLIKNIDDVHTFEYYNTLKKSIGYLVNDDKYGSAIPTFVQSTENANITFGRYD